MSTNWASTENTSRLSCANYKESDVKNLDEAEMTLGMLWAGLAS
jgi:hypothetical protein